MAVILLPYVTCQWLNIRRLYDKPTMAVDRSFENLVHRGSSKSKDHENRDNGG